MRDEDHGEAESGAQLGELAQDLALGDDVERGRGLIHDHELRIERQRQGDHDALALAARELVGEALETVLVEPDQIEQLDRTVLADRPSTSRDDGP